MIAAPNWAEVRYIVERKIGLSEWLRVRARLLGLPLDIVPADQELSELASELKLMKRCLGRIVLPRTGEAGKAEPQEAPITNYFDFSLHLLVYKQIRNTQSRPPDFATGTYRRQVLERAALAEPTATLSTCVNSGIAMHVTAQVAAPALEGNHSPESATTFMVRIASKEPLSWCYPPITLGGTAVAQYP